MMHVHGFGLSGRYLLPTAELLRDDFHTLVPDLPGFGRSGKARNMLDVPDLAHAAKDSSTIAVSSARPSSAIRWGVPSSSNSPTASPSASNGPSSSRRPAASTTSPSAAPWASSRATADASHPRWSRVATPDYVRFGIPSTFQMFRALTQYPTLARLLEMRIPTLVVVGTKDPLIPGPSRISEIAEQTESHVLLVMLEGAAHAINFSHPRELAHLIRLFMADQPITDLPGGKGHSRVFELHRGIHHPRPSSPPAVTQPG